MKRTLLLLVLAFAYFYSFAQTKTAYLDVYVRGGARHLKTTLFYDENPVTLSDNCYNIGQLLNHFSEKGWTLKEISQFRRHPMYSFFSRHKYHIIMMKEYSSEENPFDGLTDGLNVKEKNYDQADVEKSSNAAKMMVYSTFGY